jgi:hypothetical protein
LFFHAQRYGEILSMEKRIRQEENDGLAARV